ncbi:hypothetical protein EJ08DRAFT_695079 [Tothia fuscella]|uniref:SRR1-like domain-containing protein n=1 Tax=Tothia fuscella TaxID=1048955 RepID=A0A9P4U0S0_9PEZI|nr:hypothetical protein EJ08DRAFT_695079 [Tothia fuscella]
MSPFNLATQSLNSEPVSLAQLTETYHAFQSRYLASRHYQKLRANIQSRENLQIDCAVAVGLSSLRKTKGGWKPVKVKDKVAERSMSQMAFFMAIVQLLRRSGHTISVYAQNPGFDEIDQELLGQLGITILRSERAFSAQPASRHLKTNTFIFIPWLPFPVLCQLWAGTTPALYIGGSAIDWALENLEKEVQVTRFKDNIVDWRNWTQRLLASMTNVKGFGKSKVDTIDDLKVYFRSDE